MVARTGPPIEPPIANKKIHQLQRKKIQSLKDPPNEPLIAEMSTEIDLKFHKEWYPLL